MKILHASPFIRSLIALLIASTVVAFDVRPAAAATCPSGYMCLWSGSGYSGTFKKFNATGSYQQIGLDAVRSYHNNRTKRTWIHEDPSGDGTYACLNPGVKSGAVSGWKSDAKAVYLATIASC